MKILATLKYVRISPPKLNKILKQLRGKSFHEALFILKKFPQKSGVAIWKALQSAASNAVNNFSANKNSLIIADAYANQACILKRLRPRARGRAFKIEKKVSHVTIGVLQQFRK